MKDSASGSYDVLQQSAILASRQFAGPDDFPPSGFAGYGIIAFPQIPDLARGTMFCEAYMRTFLTSENLERRGVRRQAQMVTIWPVQNPTENISDEIIMRQLENPDSFDVCRTAIRHYDLGSALTAISEAHSAQSRGVGAGSLTGRGPFLLAWSPGGTKGSQDALVLVSDLSAVSSDDQALADFARWRAEIQLDAELWSNGWSLERLKLTSQRWADQRSGAILSIVGAQG